MRTKKNNFKNYQADKVAKRLSIIEIFLVDCKKKKVKFENITAIAESLAEEISKKENSPCSGSTILRNDKYKTLIKEYFYSQPGMKKPGESSTFIAELTASNAERENMRLRQYIANLEQEINVLKHTDNVSKTEKKLPYLTMEENQEASSKKALHLLIEHFNGLIAINENGDLIDLSKRVNNVIIPKDLLK